MRMQFLDGLNLLLCGLLSGCGASVESAHLADGQLCQDNRDCKSQKCLGGMCFGSPCNVYGSDCPMGWSCPDGSWSIGPWSFGGKETGNCVLQCTKWNSNNVDNLGCPAGYGCYSDESGFPSQCVPMPGASATISAPTSVAVGQPVELHVTVSGPFQTPRWYFYWDSYETGSSGSAMQTGGSASDPIFSFPAQVHQWLVRANAYMQAQGETDFRVMVPAKGWVNIK